MRIETSVSKAPRLNKYILALLMITGLTVVGCSEQTLDEIVDEVNAAGRMTNAQAESLSQVKWLQLNGLTSITDAQAESLSQVMWLELNGLTSITDAQAESLSKVRDLILTGLTSITDAQAENLSQVEMLILPNHLRPLIDKSKNE